MKKIIALVISLAVFVSVLPANMAWSAEIDTNKLATYPLNETEICIEAEDGYIQSLNIDKRHGKVASDYECLYFGGTKLDDPPKTHTADVSYRVNIPETGYYYVYMRYSASGTGGDSMNFRWDNSSYIEATMTVTGAKWDWNVLGRWVFLSEGEHRLDLLHREVAMLVDCFYVTQSYKGIDIEAEEERIATQETLEPTSPEFAVNSKAPTYTLSDLYATTEAEDNVANTLAYRTLSLHYQISNDIRSWMDYAKQNASGGEAVLAIKLQREAIPIEETETTTGIEFNFIADKDTPAVAIWGRIIVADGGSDSSFVSLDGEKYESAPNYNPTKDGNGNVAYEWRVLANFTDVKKGTKHNFRLHPREVYSLVDKFVISGEASKVPTGKDGVLIQNTLPSDYYPKPEYYPVKGQHPRVYFTAADIPTIKANMQKPGNEAIMKSYNAKLALDEDGSLSGIGLEGYMNYNADVAATIEAYALEYAVNGNAEYGQKAKQGVLNFLDTVTFDGNAQDVTRPIGHTIFFASEIYDWCYDLFSEEERKFIISKCESFGLLMEVGYPPKGQGAVVGHGSEAQIMRDLLGFGIATYDERPDIYNYVAGRFFSEFIEPRNYWYPSETHWQGDAYGIYRYFWEVVAQAMIYRMTGGDNNGGVKVFDDTQSRVPYYWIYTRRPDGQFFRTGDCYLESGAGSSARSYWGSATDMMFLSGNFYKDPIVKGEYFVGNPNHASIVTSSVFEILFNEPDLEVQTDKNTLPLSHYFGSPSGMMIARTGWDMDSFDNKNPSSSDDVVAMMKIGELWSGNHHHRDAGNFQLYYKGILASESGSYESYGTFHDRNYNKRSIAHNVITVYDPDEKFGSSYTGVDRYGNKVTFPNDVNDGGQRTPGGEPSTFDYWMTNNYTTGIVFDHGFGPDEQKPEYTYIKGDIAQAYSDKVSKVMRSMVFMPLEDENYPAMMVIMDKVVSTNAAFKKKWLLHMQLEPEIDTENGISIIKNNTNGYNGKLTVKTLLPKNAEITKVGGDDKRYWIGNQAGDFENDGYNFEPAVDYAYGGGGIEAGWGRIEVSPSTATLTDRFLNVLAVSDADNTAQPLDAELIEGENLTGVKTAGKVLMFSEAETANVYKNRVLKKASFTVNGNEESLDILVAGVKAGTWKVTNGNRIMLVCANDDDGVLYFEGRAGKYSLEYYSSKTGYNAEITNVSAKKDGDMYDVSVNLLGYDKNAKVFVALYNTQNRLVKLGSANCPETGLCTVEIDAATAAAASVVKVFIWNGDMKTMAKMKEISADTIFK